MWHAAADRPHPSPRKQSISRRAGTESYAQPESFFLLRRDDMDHSEMAGYGRLQDTAYGVQSLDEAPRTPEKEPQMPPHDERYELEDDMRPTTLCRTATARPINTSEAEPRKLPLAVADSQILDNVPSLPLTPLIPGSPVALGSLNGSPESISTRSFRRSDDISISDETSSRALESSDDEALEGRSFLQSSAPQLVMPSIRMPSRRPFTDRGKSLGRLKVMVAGSTGLGKTSLLKSIVQTCEDIVHVDPLPQNTSHTRHSTSKQADIFPVAKPRRPRAIPSVTEVYASTKPYPAWWSDLEDSRVLRRRKSLGDVVLERNICFVDTLNSGTNRHDQTGLEIQYMMKQFHRATAAIDSTNADLQSLLSGNGGAQVDAILYLISDDTITSDIQCIKRLSEFSNVIPLIAKADTLSTSQIQKLKTSFLQKMREHGIRTFFGHPSPEEHDSSTPLAPFSVSSATANDDEMMDASVLMSPEYVQPLVASELGLLIDRMFTQDNFTWFRHSAAKKLVQSCSSREPLRAKELASTSSTISDLGISQFNTPFSSISNSQVLEACRHGGGLSEYALARVSDFTQREENFAQVKLAKWAIDLQNSLQNERKQYVRLAQNERVAWLTERLDECVTDGTLVPIGQVSSFQKEKGVLTLQRHDGRHLQYCVAGMSPHDPLGLIRMKENMKRRGWVVLQVIGGVGVVGGLAFWLAKTLGYVSQDLSNWVRIF
ncbi:hypothetical protein LOZ39_002585 [Ophidiomyces ophidiicola]|nr:hypothetical protein LOZ62_002599 [Ophidiomyces ophidiicola]KAI2053972.1 hypothetical protein LOZ38_001501 [Ophidiomyces ophidiicola]KAI2075026.1 hypothetical protein LOZ37_003640 [Ophidiomyces ophidiicola]KAI2076681.1 hypothetical protein LOZ39_002585 [Ophidiomyces ophidiicola]KAI2093927.1 hypothetical protein LOZ35_004048 [Ophidiomyces ophidiicola]